MDLSLTFECKLFASHITDYFREQSNAKTLKPSYVEVHEVHEVKILQYNAKRVRRCYIDSDYLLILPFHSKRYIGGIILCVW